MKFSKPPIIELIAELRWLPVTSEGVEVETPNALMFNGPEAELFYSQFGSALAKKGFGRSERLVPAQFPVPIYNPMIRFSRPEELSATAIIQVGPGLLSVHALPPYENWEAFRPVILHALDALMVSRKPSSRSRIFTRIHLRYLDVFSAELTGGRGVARFINDVLGVKIDLPVAMTDEASDNDALEFGLTVTTKTKSDMDLKLYCGPHPGQEDGTTVLMDTTVGTSKQIAWDNDAPMIALDAAHESIRRLFVGLTAPISEQMQLIEGGE